MKDAVDRHNAGRIILRDLSFALRGVRAGISGELARRPPTISAAQGGIAGVATRPRNCGVGRPTGQRLSLEGGRKGQQSIRSMTNGGFASLARGQRGTK